MHRDKLALSVSQFEAIKLQIRVEMNKCNPRIEPLLLSRTPPQKKHFENLTSIKATVLRSNKENSAQAKMPQGKKHFGEKQATLSPMNIHRERKHFNRHNAHHEGMFLEPGAERVPSRLLRSVSQLTLTATPSKPVAISIATD